MQLRLARLFSRSDAFVSTKTGEAFNPLLQLGSLAIVNILLALVSGVLLLFFYDVNIQAAHESVASMAQVPWGKGLLHSLHRYSSDLAIFFALLHFAKILVHRLFRGPRALSWVTGCIALLALWFIGWTGFWLAWDHSAFLVAQFSTRLVDGIPLFGTTLEASLLMGDASNSNIFFIVFFVHMLLPLALFIILWIHVSRVSRPKFLPARKVIYGALVLLFLMSLILPVPAGEKASPFLLKEHVSLDAFYLWPLWLFEKASAPGIWASFLLSFLGLNLVPWIFKGEKIETSFVTESRCVGCMSCFNDCPYQAIELLPRTDGKPYKAVAWVNPERCMACGVCNGSCDTLGNNLPGLPTEAVLQKIDQWARQRNSPQWLLFACRETRMALEVEGEDSCLKRLPNFRVLEVPCAGHVNPQSVRRALERGFQGVFIAASLPGDCLFREGDRWLEERLSDQRKPLARLKPEQVRQVQIGHYALGDHRRLLKDLEDFSRPRRAS